jgi:hypothetical protein
VQEHYQDRAEDLTDEFANAFAKLAVLTERHADFLRKQIAIVL